MADRSVRYPGLIGLAWVLASLPAAAGNCLSRPEPFQLRSDTVQWSMVIGRSGECLQGLRGRTMLLESVSVFEQPKSGLIQLQGPSFRYSAGPEAGSDSFRLVIVGTSMRMQGTSTVNVDVQVR